MRRRMAIPTASSLNAGCNSAVNLRSVETFAEEASLYGVDLRAGDDLSGGCTREDIR